MQLKEGVILAGLDIRMRRVLLAADRIYSLFGKELVVTSGLDGVHSAGSYHYYGLAVDLRTNYFSERERLAVKDMLIDELSEYYDVVLHSTHMHVEFDVKRYEDAEFRV